jgi:hypothetical protein
MKLKQISLFLPAVCGLLLMNDCINPGETDETPIHAIAPVTVCSPRGGKMTEYIELTATTSFLVKAVIKSPVSGYVEKCNLSPGDRVGKNQVLFMLRTKESAALQNDSITISSFPGTIRVTASIEGVIAVLDHPKGDYVQEGDPLCSIVLPESLVFLLDVPFEQREYVRANNEITLMLPGNEEVKTMIRSVLPSMSEASQTQRVILQPVNKVVLPENLIARVRIIRSVRRSAAILPKSAILSDEVMKQFWVMKLISDSVAVKVPVSLGIMGTDSADVLTPVFHASDRILTSGNYGIGDTASVRIMNK